MSATYDPTLPTTRDWVRILTGDTDTANAFFQDEELDAFITETVALAGGGGETLGTKYCAALTAWQNLIARLGAVRGDGTVGPIVEKMVSRLRITFGGGRDNTLQEGLVRYQNYLSDQCALHSSRRPVIFESLGKVPTCPNTVVKSSGESGT